jgi:hypothetical protein
LWQSVSRSVSQSVGGLHAQNVTITDGLAKDPAFSVLAASHAQGGGRGGGASGRRGSSAALGPDAFEANQGSEPKLDVFPVAGFDALGRPCELPDEEGRSLTNGLSIGGGEEGGRAGVAVMSRGDAIGAVLG